MITEWLMSIGVLVSNWFASLWPTDFQVPDFIVNLDTMINDILANLSGVGVWADWVFILAVVGVVLVVWLLALGVKVLRAIAAHIPFFGGAG